MRCGGGGMMKNSTIRKYITMGSGVLLGNICNALAVSVFIVPNGILMGGSTGIGLSIDHFFSVDLSLAVFVINVGLFLLGAAVLGKHFALTTLASSVLYPALLGVFERIPGLAAFSAGNIMLSSIFGGLILGIGIGLIVRQGASTGGTDILAMVIGKYTHISVAALLYVVDFIILGAQAFFSTPEQILYGVLALILTTLAMNRVVVMGQEQIQLLVISEQYENIRETLLNDLDVGVSMLLMETGFERAAGKAILCVVQQRKLHAVHEAIRRADANAFVTVSRVKEVTGRGFSMEKLHAERKAKRSDKA